MWAKTATRRSARKSRGRGPDGSVFVQTLGCGLERITDIASDKPQSKLVYTFPGDWCGVPTIVGHYLVQAVPATHGLIVVDIANPAKPVEVSRLSLGETYRPHWTGWDAKTQHLVVTGSEPRLFLLKLDVATGAISMDEAFHDADDKPGFTFAEYRWSGRRSHRRRSLEAKLCSTRCWTIARG